MIHANFINNSDNVPFLRVYKSLASFKAAVRRMEGATFKDAVDFVNYKIYRPRDLV